MTEPKIIQGDPTDIMFAEMKKRFRGPMGLEGRSPVLVQATEPTEKVSEIGDIWFKTTNSKLFVKTVTGWEEIAKRGIQGLDGEMGPKPIAGKDYPIPKDGKNSTVPGPPGKDADLSEAKLIAEVVSKQSTKDHEKKYDHALIDPFLVGTKKISEAGMEDGQVITYDEKGDRLIYTTIKQIASKVSRLAGRGLSLPSQSTRVDRILQTNGTQARWGMKISVSAIQPTNPELYDLWVEI